MKRACLQDEQDEQLDQQLAKKEKKGIFRILLHSMQYIMQFEIC